MCNIITKQHCWLLWMCCSLSLSVRLCACACTLSLFDSLPLYFFPPRSVTTSLSFFHATFLFHPCPGVLGSALLGRFLYSMFPCPVLSLLLCHIRCSIPLWKSCLLTGQVCHRAILQTHDCAVWAQRQGYSVPGYVSLSSSFALSLSLSLALSLSLSRTPSLHSPF